MPKLRKVSPARVLETPGFLRDTITYKLGIRYDTILLLYTGLGHRVGLFTFGEKQKYIRILFHIK